MKRGCKMLVVRLLREAGKRGCGIGCLEDLLGEAAGRISWERLLVYHCLERMVGEAIETVS